MNLLPRSFDEPLTILAFGPDDRWYVAGEPTSDPLLILAAIWGSKLTMKA